MINAFVMKRNTTIWIVAFLCFFDVTYSQAQLTTLLDTALMNELNIIKKADQEPRNQLLTISSKKERAILFKKLKETDSIHLTKIDSIIKIHGYPGKSKVGIKLCNVPFIIIQHGDLPVLEKYYPILEQAVKANELEKENLALLIDRIKYYKKENQIYGSQIITSRKDGKHTLYPIEDEFNVNKRRLEMGMDSLEVYCRRFKIQYVTPPK